MQLDREKFKGEEKKLKKHHGEQETLEKILQHIKQCQSYEELRNNPISMMYGFEKLKHEMSGYYSFNLCKRGGTKRLLFKIDKENNVAKLEYITTNHYEDFKQKIKS